MMTWCEEEHDDDDDDGYCYGFCMKQAQCPTLNNHSIIKDMGKWGSDESYATGLIASHEDLKKHVFCACNSCGKHMQGWPVFEAACKASGVAEPNKTADVSDDDICKDSEYGGCKKGDWGGGKSYRHTCRQGVNFVTHYQELGCAGAVVEDSEHGDQCCEDKGRYGEYLFSRFIEWY